MTSGRNTETYAIGPVRKFALVEIRPAFFMAGRNELSTPTDQSGQSAILLGDRRGLHSRCELQRRDTKERAWANNSG